MAGAGIPEQFLEQIRMLREIPEMMMRIDDLEIGLDDWLPDFVEPVLPDARHARADGAMRLFHVLRLR